MTQTNTEITRAVDLAEMENHAKDTRTRAVTSDIHANSTITAKKKEDVSTVTKTTQMEHVKKTGERECRNRGRSQCIPCAKR